MEYVIALFALSAMEIVLGIDNIIFIAILTGRLPEADQPKARRLGLTLALVMRIALLLSISFIMRLTQPIVVLSDYITFTTFATSVNEVSVKDLILIVGGLFLIWKSVHEMHKKFHEHRSAQDDAATYAGQEVPRDPAAIRAAYRGVLLQIAMMDIIFSLDSVITAVGMVENDTKGLAVMIAAVVLAVIVMLIFSESVSRFVSRNPTLKVLALSFLILIGVMLVGEGIGSHVSKGYIYFAMAFALAVEVLNLRLRRSLP